nr:hypothetical protein [Bacteroidota bacterium]
MKTKTLYLLLPFFSLLAFSCHQEYKKVDQEDTPVLKGLYLGQKPPDTVPEIFAPGIVSNGMDNRDMAIMPDGREIYFTTTVGGTEYVTILYSKEETGSWTRPEVVSFAGNPEYMYYEPCLALDGQKLFFTSNMPINDSIAISEPNIWFVIRHDDTWSDPQLMDTVVNSNHHEYFPSVADNGTLYFTRGSKIGEYFIYRSRNIDGKYTRAEKLPKQVNSGINRFNAFIARDESYLILSVYGLSETFGGMDYYIVFRNEDDTWEDP